MNDEFGFNQQSPVNPAGSPAATPQQPYGYAQPNVYTPPTPPQTPPSYGYAPQTPAAASQGGKGSGWIGLLRVFLWIWFGLLCLGGLVTFIALLSAGARGALLGFGALIGSVLVAFLSVAGGMVALDAAANISRCATNSARILDILQKKQ